LYLFHKSFINLPKQNNLSTSEINCLINNLCEDAGLRNVKIIIEDDEVINGGAYSPVFGKKELYLTKGCLNLPSEEIAAIVGHEIIHLKNNDGSQLDWIKRFVWFLTTISTLFFMLLTLVIISKIPYMGIILSLILIPFIFIYFIAFLFYSNIDSRRFWSQIQELRADRLACELNGVTKQGVYNLLTRLDREYETNFEHLSWYKRIYYRYFPVLDHPCLSHRIELIRNYRKWSLFDYYLHSVIMVKWFILGKGWNGY